MTDFTEVDHNPFEQPSAHASSASTPAAPTLTEVDHDPFAQPAPTQASADASAPAPQRTLTQSFTDPAAQLVGSAIKGFGQVVSGGGHLAGLAVKSNPVSAIQRTLAPKEVDDAADQAESLYNNTIGRVINPIGEGITSAGKWIEDKGVSAGGKDLLQKPLVEGDITSPSTLKLGEGAKDAGAAYMHAADILGSLAPIIAGPGKFVKGEKLAAEAAEALPGIAAKIQRGLGLTADEQKIADAAQAANAAQKAEHYTNAAVGGAQMGESAAQSQRDQIQNMPQEQIEQLPEYQKAVQGGATPEQARAQIAKAVYDTTFEYGAPVGAAMAFLGTAPILQKLPIRNTLARMATGAAMEAPAQAALAVGSNAANIEASNEATGQNRSLTEGSGEAAATGGLMGAGFGAGAGLHAPAAVPTHADLLKANNPNVPDVTPPQETAVPAPAVVSPVDQEILKQRVAPTGPLGKVVANLPTTAESPVLQLTHNPAPQIGYDGTIKLGGPIAPAEPFGGAGLTEPFEGPDARAATQLPPAQSQKGADVVGTQEVRPDDTSPAVPHTNEAGTGTPPGQPEGSEQAATAAAAGRSQENTIPVGTQTQQPLVHAQDLREMVDSRLRDLHSRLKTLTPVEVREYQNLLNDYDQPYVLAGLMGVSVDPASIGKVKPEGGIRVAPHTFVSRAVEHAPEVTPPHSAEPAKTDESAANAEPPRAPFEQPGADQQKKYVADMQAHGVPDSVIQQHMPQAPKDSVTGFYDARSDKVKSQTVQRAIDHVTDTGEQAQYVSADIANLGGLNDHVGNNAEAANAHYRAMSDILADELGKTGGDVVPMRTGGDELGAVVVNSHPDATRAAVARAQERISEYAKHRGLDVIPHPKREGEQGVGMHIGVSDIEPESTVKEVLDDADKGVNVSKKGGGNVARGTTGETGAIAPEGQSGRAVPGVSARGGGRAPEIDTEKSQARAGQGKKPDEGEVAVATEPNPETPPQGGVSASEHRRTVTGLTPEQTATRDRWVALANDLKDGETITDPATGETYTVRVVEAGKDNRGKEHAKGVFLKTEDDDQLTLLSTKGDEGKDLGLFGVAMNEAPGRAWIRNGSKPKAGDDVVLHTRNDGNPPPPPPGAPVIDEEKVAAQNPPPAEVDAHADQRRALQRIARGESPDKVLAGENRDTINAVAKALGKEYSPKASDAKIAANLGKIAIADRMKSAKAAHDKLQPSTIGEAAREAAAHPENPKPEPTEAQKDAGNYQKGHIRLHGLDISIETPAGTSRRPEWPPLKNHYGYVKLSSGADGDHVDVFLGDHAEDASLPVFVIDQKDPNTGKFDEHKVIMGASSGREARAMYQDNYHKGWNGFDAIREMTLDQFKHWIKSGDTTKPAKNAKLLPEAPRTLGRTPEIQAQFDANLAAIKENGLKAGDRVTFEHNGKTVEGTIAKGDHAGMVKDMGIFKVLYPGRNGGTADVSIGATRLNKIEPTPKQESAHSSATLRSLARLLGDKPGSVAEVFRGLSDADARALAKVLGKDFHKNATAAKIGEYFAVMGKDELNAATRKGALDLYRTHAEREAKNPDYFGTDLAKELFPEYNASKEARRDNNDAVQSPAGHIAVQAFMERLRQPVNKGDEIATLMAGGAGAGKTTATPKKGIVYDSTAWDINAARKNINAVLNSGRKVEMRYVFNNPVTAFKRMLKRGTEDVGRVVELNSFVNTHKGSYDTVRALQQEYAGNKRVHFDFFDNRGEDAVAVDAPPEYDYNGLTEKLQNVLDTEHQEGRISAETYERVAGRRPAGTVARSEREDGGRGVQEAPRGSAGTAERPEDVQAEGLVTPESEEANKALEEPKTPPIGGVSVSESAENQAPHRGEVGGKLAAGEVVLTASGRKTTPFPKVDTGTDGKTLNTVKRVDTWLMQNALDEARSRGDEFNARQFESNLKKPSQADKDSAEEYLFGKQPEVLRSPLKSQSVEARLSDQWKAMDYGQRETLAQAVRGDNRKITHRIALSEWDKLGEGERADIAKAMSAQAQEPANAPPPPPTATAAEKKAAAKAKATDQRNTEQQTFAAMANDAQHVGKSAVDLKAEIVKQMPWLKDAAATKMANLLERTIKKNAAEIEKQKNRDPAVHEDAVGWASRVHFKQATDVPADRHTSFLGGWKHALSGKTKSTLTGENLPDLIAGYENAAAWMKTEAGKAWYEGKPAKKLENTGADLRRWYEQLREKAKSDATDGKKLWAHMQGSTNRAELFPIKLADGAAPGLARVLDYVRDQALTFPTYFENWVQSSSNPLRTDRHTTQLFDSRVARGRRARWLGSVDDRAERYLNDVLSGSHVTDHDAPEAQWVDSLGRFHGGNDIRKPLKPMSREAVRDTLLDVVRDYIKDVETVRTALSDAKSGAEFEAALDKYKKDHAESYSRLFSGNTGDLDLSNNYSRKYSRLGRLLAIENEPVQQGNKAKPLTPPRLDRVTRTGLNDRREGNNVTPEQFKDTFGFADVGFGKWVKSKADQDHLNYAYDAFMDLAEHFGIPPKLIGLGGKMHFTIGSLGHGKFAAHFSEAQPHPNGGTVPVINVTNTRGDGTVYHEWLHAFDLHGAQGDWQKVRAEIQHLLTKKQPTVADVENKARNFLVGGSYWENSKRMDKVDAAIRALDYYFGKNGRFGKSDYKAVADKLGEDYWGNDKELFARAGEAWATDTLKGVDTYLVNPAWSGDGMASPKNGHRGTPYPTGAERQAFNAAFDALTKATSVKDGKLHVDYDKFTAAMGDVNKEAKDRIAELKNRDAMQALYDRFTDERKAEIRQYDEKLAAKKESDLERARAEQEEMDRLAAEKLNSIAPPVAGDTMGKLTDGDLSDIFDEAAAELTESTQRDPDAPAPGEAVAKLAQESEPQRAALGVEPKLDTTAKPQLAEQQAKTAAALAKEAAKQGVKGIDEAMMGLVKLFGGGNGRLNSFPAGFDHDAYKAAKPHFEKALEAFQEAGKSLKDLFKFLIQNFGAGIKDYAVQFAKDKGLTSQLGEKTSASAQVAAWVKDRLGRGAEGKFTSNHLFEQADKAHEGTQAQGKYTPKDAYDAMEAGVNQYIAAHPDVYDPNVPAQQALETLGNLQRLTERLPTQTKRTAEQDAYQQFSTPPTLAYLANWVAKVGPHDVMLEPSAGIGGLAVFSKNAGAKLVLNELSSRRADVLREVFPSARVSQENAEQIDNILPPEIQPTVVVMNPPFSSSAERGVKGTSVGAQHVEQALARLAPDGRLVAIVGDGMRYDAKAFKAWWDKIGEKYAVRAVIPVEGKEYAKYGTTFDNVLVVIDKAKPDGAQVVTTPAKAYNDLVGILQGIRDGRSELRAEPENDSSVERDIAEQARTAPVESGEGGRVAEQPGAGEPASVVSGKPLSEQGARGARAGNADTLAGEQPGSGVRNAGGRTATGRQDAERGVGDASRSGVGLDGRQDAADRTANADTGLSIEAAEQKPAAELTDSVFESYKPQKLNVPGARPHPGPLVESAAMASVEPPAPTYTPNLPREVVTEGKLSLPQIEAVVYAGQAHEQFMDNGERRGYFVGSGTGTGKGRVVSGIILDNLRQGRNKAVWISEKQGLMNDAKRDFTGVGGDSGMIFNQNKTTAEKAIDASNGVLFTTYSTLRSGAKSHAAADKAFKRGMTVRIDDGREFALSKIDPDAQKVSVSVPVYGGGGKSTVKTVDFNRVTSIDGVTDWQNGRPAGAGKKVGGQSRLDQLVKWLGEDFDGALVFDEAHNAAGALPAQGKMGATKASEVGKAVLELQQRLPKARVVYVSATGATKVENLAYASRLGLWGKGTSFPSVKEFIQQMNAGGLATMELVARDLKQQGSYTAPSLSYDGVTYSRLEHQLNSEQRAIYDRLAQAWQVTLQNFDKALEITGAKDADSGKAKNSQAVSNAKSAFWGAQQRFFNQVITAMQMPTVIEQAEKDLAAGRSVVMQLVNTNEAAQERAVERQNQKKALGEEVNLEDLDLTPRDMLMQMVEKSFPVAQIESYVDENGKKQTRFAVDSQGNNVVSREAVALRDELLKDLADIKVPDGPLEMVLNHFGPDAVAEVTGRGRRVVRTPDENGEIKAVMQPRGANAARADADAFMSGKKKILVFSDAGGTGFSFHADRTAENQDKRMHYLVQPGWRADKAVQGLGRTHRTNEEHTPHYYLAATDIPAHARFLSAIARRLDQLGALTRGQRDSANQGLFSEKDNLESKYATQAVQQTIKDGLSGQIEGLPGKDMLNRLGLDNIVSEDGTIAEDKYPETSQFLNRMLSLELPMQEKVFNAFITRMEEKIEAAAARGELDTGMQTIKALESRIAHSDTIYTDPRTKAETKLLDLELTQANDIYPFPDARKQGKAEWVVNNTSGKVYLKALSGTVTDRSGKVQDRYRLMGTNGSVGRPASELGKNERGEERYRSITEHEAKQLWEAENAQRPATITKTTHMITGSVLPIWDRLQTGDQTIQVQRTQTNAGERLLGRVIPANKVAEIRKRFSLSSPAAKLAPHELMAAVLKGQAAELSNGWRIERSRVANDLRLELKPGYLTHAAEQELLSLGLFNERIDWKTRWFIPTDEGGKNILSELLKSKPVIDLTDKGATESPQHSLADTTANPDRDSAVADLRAALTSDRRIGKDLSTLERSGALTIVHDPADRFAGRFENGKITLNAAYAHGAGALGDALHEVVHREADAVGGFRNYFAKGEFNRLQKRMDALKAGGGEAADLVARAEARAAQSGEAGDRKAGERLAYFIEEAKQAQSKSPKVVQFVREVVAAMRAAVYASDFGRWLRTKGRGIQLTPDDFVALAERALKRQANEVRYGTVPETAGASQYSLPRMAGTFYSALTKSLTNAKGAPKKGGEALKQWLDGAQRRGEFKGSERQWLGVDQWLDDHPNATREELTDFVRSNQVEVKAVKLGKTPTLPGLEADGENIRGRRDEAKFAAYTLPGGENYREHLLTLPPKEPSAEAIAAMHAAGERYRKAMDAFADARDTATQLELKKLAQARDQASEDFNRARDAVAAERGQQFKSGHFDKPNILAHVRMDDREMPTYDAAKIADIGRRLAEAVGTKESNLGNGAPELGVRKGVITPIEAAQYSHARGFRNVDTTGAVAKALHIAEIQSDWHQKGRKTGYGNLSDKEVQERSGLTPEQWSSVSEDTRDDARRAANKSTVPDAPLKNTEDWAMLGFKHALREAVEQGKDRVTWDTGDTQADRYDLSKHIDSLHYNEEKGILFGLKNGHEVHLNQKGVTPDKLPEIVGKDVAAKLLAQEPNKDGQRNLSGVALKVGGEGMRGFYDQILPKAVEKYVKQWGGKVGKSEITTHHDNDSGQLVIDAEDPGANAAHPQEVIVRDRTTLEGVHAPFDNLHDALAWLDANEPKSVVVHSVEITPAMRESVLAGQPLFSRAAKTDTPEFERFFRDSKVVDAQGKPLVVHHGTAEDFHVFEDAHGGRNTGHMTAPLGHFFAVDRTESQRYAEKASQGVPADERVIDAYLSIQNPKSMSLDEFMAIDSQAEARALKAKLQAEGYDGIHLKDAGHGNGQWIAFDSRQVKDVGNRGTFDSTNPDIRYRRTDRTDGNLHTSIESARREGGSDLGSGSVKRLEKAGMQFITRADLDGMDLREGSARMADGSRISGRALTSSEKDGVRGVTINGKPYIVADNIPRGDVAKTIAHEVVHANGEKVLGGKAGVRAIGNILHHLAGLKDKAGNPLHPEIRAAIDEIPTGTSPDKYHEEIIAHAGEFLHNDRLWSRIKDTVLTNLARLGIGRKWADTNEALIRGMVRDMMRDYQKQTAEPTFGKTGETAKIEPENAGIAQKTAENEFKAENKLPIQSRRDTGEIRRDGEIAPGDRVRVTKGIAAGKEGTAVRLEGDATRVRLDDGEEIGLSNKVVERIEVPAQNAEEQSKTGVNIPPAGDESDTTGIKNAKTAEWAEAHGQEHVRAEVHGREAAQAEARDRLARDPAAGQKLAVELSEHPLRAVTDTDAALMNLHLGEVRRSQAAAVDRVNELASSNDEQAKIRARIEMEGLDAQLATAERAGAAVRERWHSLGMALQDEVTPEGLFARWKKYVQARGGGKPLSAEAQGKIKELTDKIAKLEQQIAAKARGRGTTARDPKERYAAIRAKIEEIAKKQDAVAAYARDNGVSFAEAMKRFQGEAPKQTAEQQANNAAAEAAIAKDMKRENSKQAKQQDIAFARTDVRSLVREMARALVEGGETDAQTLVDRIHDDVGKTAKLSRDMVRDIIAGVTKGTAPTKSELTMRMEAIRKELRAEYNANKQDSRRDTTRQKALRKQLDDVERRIAASDFSKVKREAPKYNEDTFELQRQVNIAKRGLEKAATAAENANKSLAGRIADKAIGIQRLFILSHISALQKLPLAAVTRIALHPFEELAGAGLRKIPGLSKIAELAPRHGAGFTIGAEAESLRGIRNAGKGAMEQLRRGYDALDDEYGSKWKGADEWTNLSGRVHSALKEPAKLNEFYRSFYLRSQHATNEAIRSGMSPAQAEAYVNRPSVKYAIGEAAYADAMESIMQGKNALVDAIDGAVRSIGKSGAGGKAFERLFDIMVPIKKVPGNIVKEATSYAIGGIKVLPKLKQAMQKGADTLTPEQADYVIKNLKKQSVGVVLMGLGYALGPAILGGLSNVFEDDKKAIADYYKRLSTGKPMANTAKVGDVYLNPNFFHAAPLEVLQAGAQFRAMREKENPKDHSFASGLTEMLKIAGSYALEEGPTVGSLYKTYKFAHPGNKGTEITSNILSGMLVPGAAQDIAKFQDYDAKKDQNRSSALGRTIDVLGGQMHAKTRYPQSIAQGMQASVPDVPVVRNLIGSRKEVPTMRQKTTP